MLLFLPSCKILQFSKLPKLNFFQVYLFLLKLLSLLFKLLSLCKLLLIHIFLSLLFLLYFPLKRYKSLKLSPHIHRCCLFSSKHKHAMSTSRSFLCCWRNEQRNVWFAIDRFWFMYSNLKAAEMLNTARDKKMFPL